MKRIPVLVAAAAVVAVVLTGCSSGGSASDDSTNAASAKFGDCALSGKVGSITLHPVTSGTLTVATTLPNPGFWDGASPETVNGGMEYCLAADIAHMAGLGKIAIKNLSWDQFISGTATGYDIAMASVTITPERKKVFDFSQPYFSSNLGVAVKAGSPLTAQTIKDAKIGVLQGNVGADWVTDTLKPTQQPSNFSAQADMFTALQAGQVDAVVTDTTLALANVKASNGALVVKAQYALDQGYGVITPKGSKNTSAVNDAVGDLKASGALNGLSTKWLKPLFGIDPNAVTFWKLPQ